MKKYEFNDSDLKMVCDTVDTWMEKVAQVMCVCCACLSLSVCVLVCRIVVQYAVVNSPAIGLYQPST